MIGQSSRAAGERQTAFEGGRMERCVCHGEAADNGSFCANWTETELMELVEIGSTQQTGTKWTFFEDFPSYCSDVSRLYCFED